MMMETLWVPVLRYAVPAICPKTTAQQKGEFVVGGHVRHFEKKKVRESKAEWAAILRPARDAFGEALRGAVRVEVAIVWPHTKATPKRDLGKLLPMEQKPDLDNLSKSLLDLMTTMAFWGDDRQVQTLRLEKWRGPVPQFLLSIWAWGGELFRHPVERFLGGLSGRLE